jgi:Spy/CpxP family protein refolding chaperone
MKHYWTGLAALCLVVMSGSGFAEGFGGPRDMPGDFGNPEWIVEHLSRRLDLDDTQQKALQNVVDAAAPEMNELRDKARQNREAIRNLDVADPDYDAKLADLARQNGELATSATLLHGRLRAEIAAVLTPEQQKSLAEDMKHEGKRRHDHP